MQRDETAEAEIVCIPVASDGSVDPRWGRAARLAIAQIGDGRVIAWTEHAVGWDTLHDEGTEGSHHARVARFLTDHGVDLVVAGHMGDPMVRMLGQMGIAVRLGASGDARLAVANAIERTT